jgi:hypothetical protein
MARSGHSAFLRTFTVLFLLWVGLDLGAHGLFASDFPPVAQGDGSVRLSLDESCGTGPVAPDHCFCHSLSIGAVVPACAGGLTPVGTLVLDLPPQLPPGDPHPFDRPPQLLA